MKAIRSKEEKIQLVQVLRAARNAPPGLLMTDSNTDATYDHKRGRIQRQAQGPDSSSGHHLISVNS